MRFPRLRNAVVLLAGIPLFCLCASCSVTADPNEAANYSRDARRVVAEIEAAHPVFLMDEIPKNYEAAKAEYLDTVKSPMKRTDFLLSTQKYLAALGDGHMGGGLPRTGRYIAVQWLSIGDRLYLLDEKGRVTDEEVIRIGNVPVIDVQKQVGIYYFAENDSAKQRQYGTYCRQDDMLLKAGCRFTDTVELVTKDGSGAENTRKREFISADIRSVYYGGPPPYVVKHEMLGDVFYIDLRTFRESNDVTETASAIKKAVAKGSSKFIIDVRGNGGGNSNVGRDLLAAMGMTPPKYGCCICHSDLSRKFRREPGNQGVTRFAPDPSTAKRNDGVKLVVLTDRLTFSSATMLGVWVQDGNLGTIVGQPSSNAPSCYGDMLSVHLPISGVNLQISYKKFLRPNTSADQDTLRPDIPTGFDEDALEVALKYLAGK